VDGFAIHITPPHQKLDVAELIFFWVVDDKRKQFIGYVAMDYATDLENFGSPTEQLFTTSSYQTPDLCWGRFKGFSSALPHRCG
jgi:hypothetical protein